MNTKELIKAVKNERGSAFQNCNDCEYGTHNGEVIEKLNRFAELEDKIEQGTLKEIPELPKETVLKTDDIAELLTIVARETRKETAEKFAKRLKANLLASYTFDDDCTIEELEFDGATIQRCIDEICKEITERKVNDKER